MINLLGLIELVSLQIGHLSHVILIFSQHDLHVALLHLAQSKYSSAHLIKLEQTQHVNISLGQTLNDILTFLSK